MLITATADCIDVTEREGQALIADWLKAADLPADCWPLDRDGTAALLVASGYDIDAEGLRKLGAMGQVPDLENWDARDVMAAAASLEARRQWALAPSPHDLKKSHYRLMLETYLAAGPDGVAEFRRMFGKFDLRFALVLLVEADSREIRERLFATVTGLLAAEGVAL